MDNYAKKQVKAQVKTFYSDDNIESKGVASITNTGNKGSIFSRIAVAFSKRFRVTILLLIAITAIGALTYTSLLKREGFPAVQLPIAFVQTPYFVNDASKVEKDVTSKILQAIESVDGVDSVTSTSAENYSSVVVTFKEEVNSDDAKKRIETSLKDNLGSEEVFKPTVGTFDATTYDGTNDILLTISSDKLDTEELQTKAQELALVINKTSEVKSSEVKDLLVSRINPLTGEKFVEQPRFTRVGYKDGEKLNFTSGIIIGLAKKEDVGTLEFSKSIQSEIEKLKDEKKLEGITVRFSGDFATQLNSQIASLEENIITGVLTILLVTFFLINFRAGLVIGLFVPLTLAGTFVALWLTGNTLNTISLFGLVLVLGLFVDDATVIVEAIDYQKKKGFKGLAAIRSALNKVALPDIVGTLTTLVVFAPMLAISGILGDFIKLIPITVILALAISLIFALTIIPFLTNLFIPNHKGKEKQGFIYYILNGFSLIILKIGEAIGRFIQFYVKKPVLVFLAIVLSFVLIGFGGYMASQLKFSVFPSAKDGNSISINIAYPDGTDIETAEKISGEIEKYLSEKQGGNISAVNYFEAGKDGATITVDLVDYKDREDKAPEIVTAINDKFKSFDKAEIKAGVEGIAPDSGDYPFQVQVFAEDQTELEKLTSEVRSFLNNREVTLNEESAKVKDVKIDNLNVVVRKDERRFAQVRASFNTDISSGLLVEMQSQTTKYFTADKLNDLGAADDALEFDQGFESQGIESFNSTIIALGIAVLIMYVILLLRFNSFAQPFLIFIAIPFSFAGLFGGLKLTDNPMSFFVMVGIIALSGIVVNNTIMLLDFANQERAEGKSISQAIADAVKVRFRSLLTTSTTTIAGLLPLALNDPFWESLAYTIIFGLVSSLIMVVFIFPAYYVLVEQIRGLKSRIVKRLGIKFY